MLIKLSRIFACLVLALLALPSLAQPQQGQGRGRGMMVGQIREIVGQLNLTDEQKPKVNAVLDKAVSDAEAMAKELQNADPQERGAKLREFMMSLRENIKKELTDEQNQKFDEKIQEMRQRNGQGQGGQPGQQGQGTRPMQQLARLQEAVEKLDLSAEQKGQVENVMMDMRSKFQELREKMQNGGDRQAMMDEARQIMTDAREQLQSILTPDQQQKLREELQAGQGQQPGQPGGAKPDKSTSPPTTQPAQPKMNDEKSADPKQQTDPPKNQQKASADTPPGKAPDVTPAVGLKVGQQAPDFTLDKLDGKPVQLSSFKGRLVVVMFGNYTSPAFRKRAAAFNDLFKEYGSRAQFWVVYTKESHPAGGWEVDANKDAKISIKPHTDLAERKDIAKKAKDTLRLTMPVAVDGMDDAALQLYGATENDAVLIGKDGKILLAQNWMDPYGLKRALDDAIQAKPTTQPSR